MVQWTSEKSSEKCSCGQLICRQESAVISFWLFLNVFGSKYENNRIFFFERIVVLKIFLWVHPTENRSPYQIFFAKSPANIWSKSEKHGKNYNFWKKSYFCPERSSRLIESIFDKHSELILLKVRNWQSKSSNVRMKIKKKCFSLVTCSLQNAVKKIAVLRTFFGEKFFCGTTFSSECSCVLLKNVPLNRQYAAKRAESAVNSFCHCPNVFR